MAHQHLGLQGLGGLQRDADHDDDGRAADGQAADADHRAGDNGRDGDNRQVERTEHGDHGFGC